MSIDDLIDPADLARGIADRLINVRIADDGQRIYNYSDLAVYTPGAWDNPAVRKCRGLITDPNGKIVARPWEKFFNYGQPEAGTLDLSAPVEVTDKLDGSLGIVHLDEAGRVRVATRGSFVSDQAIYATAFIRELPSLVNLSHITPLVEIIYPENRIVCDYGNREDLVLLGGVDIETGEYIGPEGTARLIEWSNPLTQRFGYRSLGEALQAPNRDGAEGLCVRFLNESRIVKIKQADYIALHRIVTGLSERTVWEAICEGSKVDDLLNGLPDELHDWTLTVWDRITSEADAVLRQTLEAHAEMAHLTERRDYALAAAKRPEVRPYLFLVLDGRDPMPSILKSLRPVGGIKAKTYSEDVA